MKRNHLLSSAISTWLLGLSVSYVNAECTINNLVANCDGKNSTFSSKLDDLTLNVLENASINSNATNIVHLGGSGNITTNNQGKIFSFEAENTILVKGPVIDSFTLKNDGIILNSNNIGISVEDATTVGITNNDSIGSLKESIYLKQISSAIIENNGGISSTDSTAFSANDIWDFNLTNHNNISGSTSAILVTESQYINVKNKESSKISATNGSAIQLVDNNYANNDIFSLENDGLVEGLGDFGKAISVDGIATTKITNQGELNATTQTIFVKHVDDFTLNNSGKVESTKKQAIYIEDNESGNTTVVINNKTGGLIQAFNDTESVSLIGIQSTTINNRGDIKAKNNDKNKIVAAIRAENMLNNPGDIFKVVNDGSIQAIGFLDHLTIGISSSNIETVRVTNNSDGSISGYEHALKIVNSDKPSFIENHGLMISNNQVIYALENIDFAVKNTGTIESLANHAIYVANLDDQTWNDSFYLKNDGSLKSGINSNSVNVNNMQFTLVNNTGDITTATDNADFTAAAISATGVTQLHDSIELINSGSISANGIIGSSMGLEAYNIDEVIVTNKGEIHAGVYGLGLFNPLNTTINNNENGILSSIVGNAVFVSDSGLNAEGDTLTLTNYGEVKSESGDAFSANVIDLIVIENHKLIESQLGKAIVLEHNLKTQLTNTDTIRSDSNYAIHASDADNFYTDDVLAITNSGTIDGVFGLRIENIQTVAIDNEDHITGEQTSLYIKDANNSVINNLETGTIEALNGTTAILSEGNSQDILNHYGHIQGNVLLGAGNDQVMLYSGMRLTNSMIDAGDDFDTLHLRDYNGTGQFSVNQAKNLESLVVESGLWELTGNGATHFDNVNVVGGTLTPGGNDLYTQLIIQTDEYDQTADASLLIDLNISNSSQNDQISIQNGSANLNGNLILASSGNVLDIKTNKTHGYTVLHADQSVNGEFANVTQIVKPSLVLSQTIRYNPNSVAIELDRRAYQDVDGLTKENDSAWATYHSNILDNNQYDGDIETYLIHLDSIDTVSKLEETLRLNDGEFYDVFTQSMLQASRTTLTTVTNQLNQRQPSSDTETTVWFEGVYGQSDLGSFDEHNRYQTNIGGLVAGLDVAVTDNFTLGAAANYYNISGDIELDNGLQVGSADGKVFGLTTYINHRGLLSENSYITGALDYQHGSDFSMDRRVAFNSDFSRNFQSKTKASSIDAMLELGFNLDLNNVDINPYARVIASRVNIDTIKEESLQKREDHASLALEVDPKNTTEISSEIGINFGTSFDVGHAKISPHLNLHVQHNDNDRELDVKYVDLAGQSARIHSNDGGEITTGVGAGFDIELGKQVSISLDGNYQTGDQLNAWGVAARLNVEF